MTKTQVEEFLVKLENQLLNNSEQKKIELSRNWANSFPNDAAVYLFRENGEICYVGETGSIKGRMNDILNTKNHTLRRNLGNHYFAELPNYEKPSSRKSFCDEIEILLNEKIHQITQYFCGTCFIFLQAKSRYFILFAKYRRYCGTNVYTKC